MTTNLVKSSGNCAVLAWVIFAPATQLWAQENKRRDIPLKTIVSTSPQSGFMNGLSKPEFDLIRAVREKVEAVFASNVFLVDGEPLSQVLGFTKEYITGSHPLNIPIPSPDLGKRLTGKYWLVAYFGQTGSSPPQWRIESAYLKGEAIRRCFRKDMQGRTDDVWPYIFWIPLGELPDGRYAVELFDEDSQEVVLMRRVIVSKKINGSRK